MFNPWYICLSFAFPQKSSHSTREHPELSGRSIPDNRCIKKTSFCQHEMRTEALEPADQDISETCETCETCATETKRCGPFFFDWPRCTILEPPGHTSMGRALTLGQKFADC